MSDSPPAPPAPERDRLRPRRLTAVVTIALVAIGASLGGAWALNGGVGSGGRDAPAMPAAPGGVNAGTAAGLPPLALVSGLPRRPGTEGLPAAETLAVIEPLATADAPASVYVELGAALQSLGRGSEALDAYREALARDPENLAARIGTILVPAAAAGPDALDAADEELAALEQERPGTQLVAFNRAWVAIYRGAPIKARRLLERTVALDPDTGLGETATALLDAFEAGAESTTAP